MAFQLERIAMKPISGGQHHQQQADAVDAEVVAGAEGGNPRRLLDELEVLAGVELECERKRDQKSDQGRDIGPQLDGARIRRGNEQQHQ